MRPLSEASNACQFRQCRSHPISSLPASMLPASRSTQESTCTPQSNQGSQQPRFTGRCRGGCLFFATADPWPLPGAVHPACHHAARGTTHPWFRGACGLRFVRKHHRHHHYEKPPVACPHSLLNACHTHSASTSLPYSSTHRVPDPIEKSNAWGRRSYACNKGKERNTRTAQLGNASIKVNRAPTLT